MANSGEAGGPQEPGHSTGGGRSGGAGSGAGCPEGPGRGAGRARRRAVVRRQRRGVEEKVLRHPHVLVLLASVCPYLPCLAGNKDALRSRDCLS